MVIIDGFGIGLVRNYIPERGVRQLFSPLSDSKPENNGKED